MSDITTSQSKSHSQLNTPGTIAFCTIGSVIVLIIAAQCYRIWRRDRRLKREREDNEAEVRSDALQESSMVAELAATVAVPHVQEQGDRVYVDNQGQRSFELSPPPVWNGVFGRRPSSGAGTGVGPESEGLEVVTPEMIVRRDFAQQQEQQQQQQPQPPGQGQIWTGTGHGSVTVLHQAHAPMSVEQPEQYYYHSQPSQTAASSVHSLNDQPSSQVEVRNQVEIDVSSQYQTPRNKISQGMHSAHSSMEITKPLPLFHRPLPHHTIQQLHQRTRSQQIQERGGENTEHTGKQVKAYEVPNAQRDVNDSPRVFQTHTQHQNSIPPETATHNSQLSLGTQAQNEPQDLDLSESPVSISSRPAATFQAYSPPRSTPAPPSAVEFRNRLRGHTPPVSQHSHHASLGQLSIPALTVSPIQQRWSWNPRDDTTLSPSISTSTLSLGKDKKEISANVARADLAGAR